MAFHNDIGARGEQEACNYLLAHGYRILERNWRYGKLEVDIIAESAHHILIVEVKTRTSTFADMQPEEYVDSKKRRFMVVAGNAYLRQSNKRKELRFDIIGILLDSKTMQVSRIQHYEDAFHPEVFTYGIQPSSKSRRRW